MYAIQKVSGKKLAQLIAAWTKSYKKVYDMAHVYAVSALYHAAAHRDPRPLNAFFKALNKNDAEALRLYYARLVATEKAPVAFLTFEKNEFHVADLTPEVQQMQDNFVKLAETSLINPDGESYKKFFERNNISESKIFDEAEFLKVLKGLEKKANKEGAAIDRTLIAPLNNLIHLAEARVTQQKAAA